MIELTAAHTDAVAGGNIFTEAIAIGRILYEGGRAYAAGMSAVGGTLSNYYGPAMTLEIVAAGNMGA